MRIRVSGTLLRFVDYDDEIAIEADTVGSALQALAARYPDVRSALYDSRGHIRGAHALFVNGERVGRDGLGLPLDADDSLEILTAIAGG
jgi:hypothetical protein